MRPRLVDRWEAAALVESLGYTDARVRREFGFANTLALGSHVFDALATRPEAQRASVSHERTRPIVTLGRSIGASVLYAFPWLLAVAIDRAYPNLVHVRDGLSPLTLALLASLVVSGGFVHALTRLGRFYLSVDQPRVAAFVCTHIFRVGAIATVTVAVGGGAAIWASGLYTWPIAVLAADQFVVLSILWMTCAMITIQHAYWRAVVSVAMGAVVFLLVRGAGGDPLSAELLATGCVLVMALAQMRTAFGPQPSGAVPLPDVSVVLFGVLPHFCYGAFYFLVLANNGAMALTSRTNALALSLALMTFLFGSAAVEYANVTFVRGLREQMRQPFDGTSAWIAAVVRPLWHRALVAAVTGYAATAVVIAAVAAAIVDGEPGVTWGTLALADAGYLLLIMGAVNAAVLVALNEPWEAVSTFAGAVLVALVVPVTLADAGATVTPAAALSAGAMFAASFSARRIRRQLRQADYAIATF